MFPIRLGLEILVPEATYRNDHPDGDSILHDMEGPSTGFDACDCIRLTKLPSGSVTIDTADAFDAVVRVEPVGLIDALDFDVCCHRNALLSGRAAPSPGLVDFKLHYDSRTTCDKRRRTWLRTQPETPMPRKRRHQHSLLESLLDTLFFGSGNQNLALGVLLLLPMLVIPALIHLLDGNQFQTAVVPYAKAGVLVFGVASSLCLLVAAVRYWKEWQQGS